MSNQRYDQVSSLDNLKWASDVIEALLVQDAVFDVSHTRLSQTGGSVIRKAPIQQRWVADGDMGMGLPAVFTRAVEGQQYQVLVTRNEGDLDVQLLAFLDEDHQGNPITVTRSGTLIVRPSQENLPTPPSTTEPAPTSGFWLKL